MLVAFIKNEVISDRWLIIPMLLRVEIVSFSVRTAQKSVETEIYSFHMGLITELNTKLFIQRNLCS